ncbi:MAG: aminotransferase class I/II-fold pyridoxal phosphate-dependent enzyme [Pseudomonadota bacterium]
MPLDELRGSSRYRVRQARQPATIAKQFASNDYLSLSQHRRLIKAAKDALEQWGTGSSGSPLLSGYTAQHRLLEEELADWLQVDSALLFSSGFAANHGVITTLIEPAKKIHCDRLCHASILEGVKHSQRRFKRFPHNQPETIKATADDWLITEGTFSMDGDYAAQQALTQQVEQQKLSLMLDDAHGLGVWGEQGRASFGELKDQVRVLTGTFGKAFGVAGAFAAGTTDDMDRLVQFCREYIYSTAFPPAQAAAIHAALDIIRSSEGQQRRQQLAENIQLFKALSRERGLATIESESPIQVWIVNDDQRALILTEQLKSLGFMVSAVRPPTVPEGTARLRFSLQADHSPEDIKQLFLAIDQCRDRAINE